MKSPSARWRKGRWILLAMVLVGVVFLGWRTVSRQQLAVRSIPPRPALDGWAVELEDRLAQAESETRSYLHPSAGLAALSRLYHANGYYDEALQCYAGLRQLEPHEARWPHMLAGILSEFGRLEEALPLRERAVQLAPAYLPARLRLGDVLLKANQLVAAAKVYTEALNQEPENPYALLGLARVAIATGDWPKARENLQQAVRLHPGFYGATTLLVSVLEHFGEQAEADALRLSLNKQEFVDFTDPWMDELTEDCFDAYRLSVAAALARWSGNSNRAVQLLERASSLAPAVGTYERQLGDLLAQTGDQAAARLHLEKAVALSSGDSDAWVLLIQTLKNLGDSGAAQRALASGLAYCPQSPSLHLERARMLNASGRRTDAIAEYRESFRLRPSEASPLVELATVLFSSGQVEAAEASLRDALRLQPDHPIALATLALIAISKADETAARGWWDRVRRQPATPPPAIDAIRQAFQHQFRQSLN